MNARTLTIVAAGGLLLIGALLFAVGGEDGRDAAQARPAGEVSGGEVASGELGPGAAGPTAGGSVAERAAGASGSGGDGAAGDDAPPAGGSAASGGAASPPAPPRDDPQRSTERAAGGSGPPTGSTGAGASTAQEPTDEILRATARRYEGVRALQADFEQQLTNTLLGRTTHSAGTLYQRQPDRFLMRFSEPEGDMIVSDGEFFWLYYPSVDPKQVIRSARGAGGLDLRSQFVGDPVRRFEATSHGRETVRGRETHVLTLTPREPTGYRRLKAWIDTEDHLVRRFELTEDNGNVRRFELTDLRVNPTLPDALFEFQPPAGAVIVTR